MNLHEDMKIKYLRLFSSFFNRSYIIDFINKNNNKIIQSIESSNHNTNLLSKFEHSTFNDFFDYIYEEIKNDYKCEYVYLNEIFLNEILKNHDSDHSIITELYVNKSQADLVIINGTTTVYEIKTELDSLSRLSSQLDDYMCVFDKIYVVTYYEMVDKLTQMLSEKYSTVGICVLNDNGNLDRIKESESHKFLFDKQIMFSILTRSEFEYFDKDYYIARETFINLSTDDAHKYLLKSLFSRGKNIEYIYSLPDSLKLAGYKIQNRLNKQQKNKFVVKLNGKVGEVL